MNFGAQMSRFSHLLTTLKIFRIKPKQCKFLFPTLKGHSPALRTVDSSGITSASAQGLFLLLPQVTALPLPCSELHCPPPCGSNLWAASQAQMSPARATGTRGAEGKALHEQGICPQLFCPSAAALALSRWAPAPGALQEQEATGTWGVVRSAECRMQIVDRSWTSINGCRSKCCGSCGKGFVLCMWKWWSECRGTGWSAKGRQKVAKRK